MPLSPQSSLAAMAAALAPGLRAIATDMDGTLTRSGRFSSHLFLALERLQQAGIPVLIVTGRSAGWVSALVEYLPIAGAIAENGGLLYRRDRPEGQWLVDVTDPIAHRDALADVFGILQTEFHHHFPHLHPAPDNRFRITDWTFDLADLPGIDRQTLSAMGESLAALGWGFTYSAVQAHIKLPEQNKAAGLQRAIELLWPGCSLDQILTIGDSPNDESLFDPALFPRSVGVANVRPYLSELLHQPAHITPSAEGEGFCELVAAILAHSFRGTNQ